MYVLHIAHKYIINTSIQTILCQKRGATLDNTSSFIPRLLRIRLLSAPEFGFITRLLNQINKKYQANTEQNLYTVEINKNCFFTVFEFSRWGGARIVQYNTKQSTRMGRVSSPTAHTRTAAHTHTHTFLCQQETNGNGTRRRGKRRVGFFFAVLGSRQ